MTPARATTTTADLTTTSYAILGLLAIKPWTTYELAQQMERSLKHFWPRATSRIYEEPKRLAALGLAKSTSELVGRRARTVYSITAKGRKTLRSWLAEPGGGPVVEFEALLKVFFGEQASRDDVLANIEAIRSWAEQQNRENVAFARLFNERGGPFPGRVPVIVLTGRFMTELADMLERWSAWAAAEVAAWPDDPSTAEPAWYYLAEVASRDVDPAPLPGESGSR